MSADAGETRAKKTPARAAKAGGRIKAVLFDMDGVLIDAKDWHYESLNEALALFGMAISRDEHLAVYDGLPTRKKLELLSRARHLPVGLHGFINDLKQRRTLEMTLERCRPMFHHQYALSRLKREGYSIAVCSNSIRQTVQAMLERAGLLEHVDFYLSNEDVSKSKPDPEMYVTAMQRLGAKPTECLIVEDNDHGIQAARASGGHLMAVGSVYDVTYARIVQQSSEAEGNT